MDTRYILSVIKSKSLFQLIFALNLILILGPSLPDDYDYRGHKMVSNGDTLFYINTFRNVFLQLTCDESLEDCHWKTLASKLQIPRYFAFVTLIPDYLGYQGCN